MDQPAVLGYCGSYPHSLESASVFYEAGVDVLSQVLRCSELAEWSSSWGLSLLVQEELEAAVLKVEYHSDGAFPMRKSQLEIDQQSDVAGVQEPWEL